MNGVSMVAGTVSPLSLDPFAFHDYKASVIKGLGGSIPNPDPIYAFHTHYVRLARGRATFTVRFTNLQAKRGTLVLRVHILPDAAGAAANMVTSSRIQLNRLVIIGGEIHVSFEAFRDATYALMAIVHGDTDASADAVQVFADRPFDQDEDRASARGDGATTQFGPENLQHGGLIVSLTAPTLGSPVSQAMTPAQIREPIFESWLQRIAPTSDEPLERWAIVYLAQCLTVYGMAQAGARGLLIGRIDPALAKWIAAVGCDVTLMDTAAPAFAPEVGRYCQIDASFSHLPHDLVDFDFLCSTNLSAWVKDGADAERVVLSSLQCLRPRGLAVHILSIGTCPTGLRRGDIERLALALLSEGHDLGQLRPTAFSSVADEQPGSFGIVARRTVWTR